MTSTAILQSQYHDETGRNAVHRHGERIGKHTDEYLQWLKTADLEYFLLYTGLGPWWVMGPRSKKESGAVHVFCQCHGDNAALNALYVCGLLNADAPASVTSADDVARGKALADVVAEIKAELPEYLR